jgi:hypothetical protein
MNTHDVLSRVAQLSDHDLLTHVKALARCERKATVALIAHLAELDARRLYLAEGYPSLFKYATELLHLSEHAAYNRIEAARAARRFPVLLAHLAAGLVNLSTVRLLAPHLTPENHHDVLALARHKSKRDIEELVARLHPQPPVPDVIRKLPTRTLAASEPATVLVASPDAAGEPPLLGGPRDAPRTPQGDDTHGIMLPVAPSQMAVPEAVPAPGMVAARPAARRAVVRPLDAERYSVQFTASAQLHAKLREAQALLRHQIPDGELEQIFDRALEALLGQLRKQKLAATDHPRAHRSQGAGAASRTAPGAAPRAGFGPASRHVPAAVKRAVWARDGGRCAFVSADGRRCAAEDFLEFHHVVPYASGGPSTVDNIELRCRAHNGYEAERHFGRRATTAVREARAIYARPAPRRFPPRPPGTARQQ